MGAFRKTLQKLICSYSRSYDSYSKRLSRDVLPLRRANGCIQATPEESVVDSMTLVSQIGTSTQWIFFPAIRDAHCVFLSYVDPVIMLRQSSQLVRYGIEISLEIMFNGRYSFDHSSIFDHSRRSNSRLVMT